MNCHFSYLDQTVIGLDETLYITSEVTTFFDVCIEIVFGPFSRYKLTFTTKDGSGKITIEALLLRFTVLGTCM